MQIKEQMHSRAVSSIYIKIYRFKKCIANSVNGGGKPYFVAENLLYSSVIVFAVSVTVSIKIISRRYFQNTPKNIHEFKKFHLD